MNNRLVFFVQIECFLFGLIECVARCPNQCNLWLIEKKNRKRAEKLKIVPIIHIYLQR